MLKAASVFSDHMVLQQGRKLPVWGSAVPGAGVGCLLAPAAGGAGVSAHTCASPSGAWRLWLPSLPAGGPYRMTIQSGGETLQFRDVWLGEVWLAGGQSNMELELQSSRDGAAVLQACADARLRFYAVPKAATPAAAEEAERQASWQIVGPGTAAALSAVAYHAMRTLASSLETAAIGVLCCYWGGTFAHCWLPQEELEAFPQGKARIEEYNARMGDKTEEEFARDAEAFQRKADAWNERVSARRAADPAVSLADLCAEYGPYPWPPPAGPASFQHPGNLYRSMLRRICPYALRGFWYYQGEQDEEHAQEYTALLTHLVRRWRADWGEGAAAQLPFLLVQLPMYRTEVRGSWPVLRESQRAVAATEPAMGLVVLADCGEEDNIHPIDKKTPGERLGLLTLETVYGKPVVGSSPRVLGWKRDGARAVVQFASVGGGLELRGQAGFELAGADGIFQPAQPQLLGPDTVCLASGAVAQPAAVRYAWYDFGPAVLYGGTGLPAGPFFLSD